MMDFSEVSKTSIVTLICRAVGAKIKTYSFKDQKSLELYDLVYDCSTKLEMRWMIRVKKKFRGLSRKSVKFICNRADTFDNIAHEFVESHSSCTIINLGCGFDTRYWRMQGGNYRFIDLDLPEVIVLKKRLLGKQINYEYFGISVLDTAWIDQVTTNGNENFLLLAEGLFMYLPKEEVVQLIQVIAERFSNSQLVFDTVHEKYTRGIWKWLTNWNWRKVLHLDFNYTYGIKDPSEIENYGNGLKITHSKKPNGHLISVELNTSFEN